MREIIATVTQCGRVTIPAEVRRRLELKPYDKVAFVMDDGQVRLEPVRFTLETAYGSVEPQSRPEDFDALIQQAKELRQAMRINDSQ